MSDTRAPVLLDGSSLTVEDLVEVARGVEEGGRRIYRRVEVPAHVLKAVEENRHVLEKIIGAGVRCYGVTTGFGPLSRVLISPEEARRLQLNVILSHASAVG